MTLAERLARLQEAIGSRPITLVAVTKYATLDQMIAAYQAGVRHFGENKIQDALEKMAQLPPEVSQGVSWHFIGHLQSNKINKTLGRFALIHSVDSVDLARRLSEKNQALGLRQPILLQVNVAREPSKTGFDPAEVLGAAQQVAPLPGLHLRGLMTIAPANLPECGQHEVFSNLATLRDDLQSALSIPLPELSMGMSQDYIQAIACGATILRIGSDLFR